MNDNDRRDPRQSAIPDTHGHCKGEHKLYAEERPLPLTARMLFLWFYHACRRGNPRFLMVADHMNYLTFEDPAAVNLVRRALKLAQAGDLHGAAETANVEVGHAAVVGEGLRRGMRYSIGAEVDNDPRSRPDAQNIVDAMRPDAIIRSVHFVPITHPTHGENWPWAFDNPEFADLNEVVSIEQLWELYTNVLVDAIERLPGHIVAHLYAPCVVGGRWPDDATLEVHEDRILAAALERGMAMEFNTRYLYRDHSDDDKQKYLAANKRMLRKCKERGIAIAVGSDAHSPKDQGGAFAEVLPLLDDLEINELAFPIGGRLLRVALKVERPPEPEPAPVPPPAPVEKPKKVRPAAVEAAPADEPAVAASAAKPPAKKKTAAAAAAPDLPAEPTVLADAIAEPAAAAPDPMPEASPAERAAEPRAAEPVAAEPVPEPAPAQEKAAKKKAAPAAAVAAEAPSDAAEHAASPAVELVETLVAAAAAPLKSAASAVIDAVAKAVGIDAPAKAGKTAKAAPSPKAAPETTTPVKPAAKPAVAPKAATAAKPVLAVKPPVKTVAVKAAAKPAPAKPAAKPAAKPVVKAPAKKAAIKAAPVKAAAKKPAPKPVVKPAPKKAASKSKPLAKSAAKKPAARPAAKPVVKAKAKPVAKKSAPVKASAKKAAPARKPAPAKKAAKPAAKKPVKKSAAKRR